MTRSGAILPPAVLILVGLLRVYAFAGEPLIPVSFRGGIDWANQCSEIEDWRACDSSNMYGDRVGSADTRNGSDRLNSTAVSTNPFSSLYTCAIATGSRIYNVMLGVSGDTIYFSTDDVFVRWLPLFRGLYTPNQKFSFAVARNVIYMTGDALTDPIFQFDVANSTFGAAFLAPSSTYTAYITAKYLLYEKGYLLAANVREGRLGFLNANTTYYDDRVYYSYLLYPSSFTIDRFLNINLGDGDYITGLTSKRSGLQGLSFVVTYKRRSAYGITFKTLNPAGEGGDQDVTRMADGFGNASERQPENIGAWDIVLSLDGILQWNGGLIARSNLEAEKVVISGRIKPLIDRLIRRGTYKSAYMRYYPKSNYLIFAYEDPDLSPQGKINSMMFYDLLTGEWWPMKNSLASSMATDNGGPNPSGRMLVGDSSDGYVHIFDDQAFSDDSRREISLDAMETTEGWRNAGISSTTVAVGTASLTLNLSGAMTIRTSSITKVAVLPLGEWYDKSASSATDMISFKVFPASQGYISIIRVDLEVRDVVNGHFDTNFSSVTISSAALTAGSSAWTTVEIPFSSFTILDNWINLQTETLPFARNLTRFGIRFVSTATAGTVLYFDDIRFVSSRKTSLDPMRLTRRFNLGTMTKKDFTQVVLTRTKPRDSVFNVDVLIGQGVLKNTVVVGRDTPQQIYVCGFQSTTGIVSLNSITLAETGGSTKTMTGVASYENGSADPNYIYSYDVSNDRLVKIDRSSPTIYVSTYGSLGASTSNFNYVQDIAVETASSGKLLLVDHMNHRLKVHNKKGLTFVEQYGQLGFGATSFYNPTSADWDDNSIWVCDDGNQTIKKFSRAYALQATATMDINTVGNCNLRIAPPYLFVAYNRGSNDAVYFIDVVLEKRLMSDLYLVNRTRVFPDGVVASSTYSLRGNIALHNKFVTLAFNDNSLIGGSYYLQKRLQSDLSLIKEIKTTQTMLGVIGDNLQREPAADTENIDLQALPDKWLQLRFYSRGELENSFKLSAMGLVADKLDYVP